MKVYPLNHGPLFLKYNWELTNYRVTKLAASEKRSEDVIEPGQTFLDTDAAKPQNMTKHQLIQKNFLLWKKGELGNGESSLSYDRSIIRTKILVQFCSQKRSSLLPLLLCECHHYDQHCMHTGVNLRWWPTKVTSTHGWAIGFRIIVDTNNDDDEGTMSHLQAKKMKKLNSNCIWKIILI